MPSQIKVDAQRPRVLAVIRWPVGGIRTWCKYVYRKPEFERFLIDIVIPASLESHALGTDLVEGGVQARLIQTGPSIRSFAAAVVSRMTTERYSLVHSHGFTSAVINALPSRARRIPHLATIHEVVLDHHYRDLRGRLIRRVVDESLRRVDCVHAVSHASRDNLQHAFPGAGRCRRGVQVISNGINPTGFLNARRDDVRQRLGLEPQTILVGFFGRFMAPKGFRYLIDAMDAHRRRNASVPDIAVLAVGGGGFRLEEEQRIKSLGLASRFFFQDFMADIAGTIKAVDVVAMPSLWEAGPLLPMEVLTAGVPLVVSDCAALKEVTEGTPVKMVPMGDSEALLQAIIEMSGSEKKTIAQSFMPVAAQRYDVSETRRRIAALYEDLIAGT
jgi:glycosyltransferase involved in cell wall biosynthesis